MLLNCLNCKADFTSTYKQKYCSSSCQQKFQNSKILEDWKSGKIKGYKAGFRLRECIREYILSKSDFKCSSCGWDKKNPKTGRCPLEIDHIDGNSENASEDNLKALCPNCHSLTPTWKALNKGKANKERLRYSRLI